VWHTGRSHPDLVTVAHRAGNDPARLAAAIEAGVDRVEADVHLFRGVLEVRHARTLGPVPVLWDRWELHGPRTPRLTFEAVLDVAHRGLYVDLKGRDPRLGPAVVAAVRRRHSGDLVISSRCWSHLDTLRGMPGVQLVPSVGRPWQVARVLERFPAGLLHGVAVHERLLDEPTVARLLQQAGVVYSWPVNDPATAQRLLRSGVTGLISDDVGLLAELADLTGRRPTPH
jgi:glycerophosphoryl diester phosphodiesterase